MMTKKFLLPGLVFGALMSAAGPVAAVDVYLATDEVDKTMPDGTVVPMWAFGLDPDVSPANGVGDCWEAVSAAARLACIQALPDAGFTVPGPRLSVGSGDTDLNIFLSNGLPTATSVVVAGMEMPVSSGPSPVWTDNSTGARTSASQRVRSFGAEATANGGIEQYFWQAASGNGVDTGTRIYTSGTHPQVQVQMGLYGGLSRDSGPGEAYTSVGFDAECDLLYSEIDPALHSAVDDGSYGTTGPTSTLDYNPRYFLINGEPQDHNVATLGPCCATGAVGDRILLRMMNAGLQELAPMMLGSHMDLVAEGGNAYQNARNQYSVFLLPNSTKDAIFTPNTDGNFPIIERRLNLTNGAASGGGAQTCVAVAPAPEFNRGGKTLPKSAPTNLRDILMTDTAPTATGGGSVDVQAPVVSADATATAATTSSEEAPAAVISSTEPASTTSEAIQVAVATLPAVSSGPPRADSDIFNPNVVAGMVTVPAPGVLVNDSRPDGAGPLTAVLVTGGAYDPTDPLDSLVLNADGSFSYEAKETVGRVTFYYQVDDGAASNNLSNVAEVSLTREIWVKKAEFDTEKERWTVAGKSSETGSTVTLYLGSSTSGPVIGTTLVGANPRKPYDWKFRQKAGDGVPAPGAETTLSVDNTASTGGIVLEETITIK